MNIYYIFKNKQLDKRFKERDIMNVSKMDIVYYLFKVIYWVWIPIGLFSSQSSLFWILLIIGFLKFPFYHLNKKLFSVYNDVYPVLCISTLITIFIYWLI